MRYASVTQLAVYWFCKPDVAGSTPVASSIFFLEEIMNLKERECVECKKLEVQLITQGHNMGVFGKDMVQLELKNSLAMEMLAVEFFNRYEFESKEQAKSYVEAKINKLVDLGNSFVE